MQATQTKHSQKELALFDLDHTLLDVDSDYLWGEYIVKHKLLMKRIPHRKSKVL